MHPIVTGLLRGFRRRCPRCGARSLFNGYLQVNHECAHCGLSLAAYPADDAPPYFTIFIVGHIVIPLMLIVEQSMHPHYWVHMSIWIPMTIVLTLGLLPLIKGAVIGLQWGLGLNR